MTAQPRLSIGLPVYNGEEYLAESLEALLGQTYEDFELVITDNASTDGTQDICRRYAKQDSRIRYIPLTRNIGAAPNHNYVFTQCRGELFKWASHDDLYARDLLKRCVEALDEHPDVILAHSDQAVIDADGKVKVPYAYTLNTGSPHAPERFRSLLFEPGGDDFYGVMRADVLRRVKPHDSYHHADRTFVAEITLHGRFHQVPELLYFRRDHPTRAERANPQARPLRQPGPAPRRTAAPDAPAARRVRVGVRVGGATGAAVPADRRACYRHLASWATSRVRPGAGERVEDRAPVDPAALDISVDALVAGREGWRVTSPGWASSVCSAPGTSATTAHWWQSWTICARTVRRRRWTPCAAAPRPSRPGTGYRPHACTGSAASTARPPARVTSRARAWGSSWTPSASRPGCAGDDLVIVPGTGILESTLPLRPWGMPYSLFLVCAAGRLLRTPVALVGVGASGTGSRPVRALTRWAAQLAAYRSYRDTLSRDAIRAMGVDTSRDEVYADLVFALPTPRRATLGAARTGVRGRHGLRRQQRRTGPGGGAALPLSGRHDAVRARAGRGGQAGAAAHRRRRRPAGDRGDPRGGGLAAGHRRRHGVAG